MEEQFTEVIDHFTGNIVTRPLKSSTSKPLKYDFDFRKKGEKWRYANSLNDLDSSIVKKQISIIEQSGGEWRILDAKTGELVKSMR